MVKKVLLLLLGVFTLCSCSYEQSQSSSNNHYGFVSLQNEILENKINLYVKQNNINLKNCIITISESQNDSIFIISNTKNNPFTYEKKPFLYSSYKDGMVVFIKNVNVFDTIKIKKSFNKELQEKGIKLRKNIMFYDPITLHVNVLKYP